MQINILINLKNFIIFWVPNMQKSIEFFYLVLHKNVIAIYKKKAMTAHVLLKEEVTTVYKTVVLIVPRIMQGSILSPTANDH